MLINLRFVSVFIIILIVVLIKIITTKPVSVVVDGGGCIRLKYTFIGGDALDNESTWSEIISATNQRGQAKRSPASERWYIPPRAFTGYDADQLPRMCSFTHLKLSENRSIK